MAIRPIREPRAPLGSVLMRPIEWAHGQSLRLLEWFNQERWTLMLTLLALLITNSFLLYLLLQGQDTRALAFVIILFVIVLSWLVPELSIAVLIVGGTGLYINLLFYTTGGAFGTGSRPILLALLLVVSLRAIYEYLRTPPAERPRVFTWLTVLLTLFWIHYMAHVLYINFFRYNVPSPDNALNVLGIFQKNIIRYFDSHVLWIGVIPMVILLRNYERAKRVLFLVGLAAFSGGVGIFLEYLTPLPCCGACAHSLGGAADVVCALPSGLSEVVAKFAGFILSRGGCAGSGCDEDADALGCDSTVSSVRTPAQTAQSATAPARCIWLCRVVGDGIDAASASLRPDHPDCA